MKRIFALILVAVMLAALFSGCAGVSNGASGGASNCNDLIEAYTSAVASGDITTLRSLFSCDHFAPDSGVARGSDGSGNLVIYNAESLCDMDFWGANSFDLLYWENIGQNTNEAELAVMAQEVYEFANLNLNITEQNTLHAQFAATLNTSDGNEHYYDQTFDVVTIGGRQYVQSVTFITGSASATNAFSGNDLQPEYYTLEQAKELGGFFVLSEDRFYPLTEGYYAEDYSSISRYCITPISEQLPCIGTDEQLVLFTDEMTQTVDVNETLDKGYTIPILLDIPYFEDYFYISRLMFYSNTQPKIEAEFTVEEWDELYSLYENYNDADELVLYSISGNTEFGTDDLIAADDEGFFIPCNERDIVTIGYLLGSSYHEVSMPAVAKLWNTQDIHVITSYSYPNNHEAEHEISVEITPYGYFIVPVNDLPSGIYNVTPQGGYSFGGYYLFEIL